MRHKLLVLGMLLFFRGILFAQTTNIIATVIDSDGTVWKNGSWKLSFIPNSSQPNINIYNLNGTALNQGTLFQSGAIDNSGHLNITTYDSTLINPTGSSWTLQICPQASSNCGIVYFSTAGSSLDISATITAVIPPPRFQGLYPNYGYIDSEVIPTSAPGSTYYDVNLQCQKYYNSLTSSWGCVAATTGFLPLTGGALSGPVSGPTFQSSLNPVIDITSPTYGALCNGTHDDSLAITAASYAASLYYAATGIQATIIIPYGQTGVCNINNTITYYSGSHFLGSGGTIVNNTSSVYTFSNSNNGDGNDSVWFDHLKIVQNTAGSLPVIAYVGGNTSGSGGPHKLFWVTDNDIKGGGYAVKTNVFYQDDTIRHTLDNIMISRNHIWCALVSGSVDTMCRDAINLNGDSTNIVVNGNIIEQRDDAAIAFTSSGGHTPTAHSGYMQYLTPTYVSVTGNVLTNDTVGLDFSGGNTITATGNTCTDTIANSLSSPCIRFIYDNYPTPLNINVIGGKYKNNPSGADLSNIKMDFSTTASGGNYPLCNCSISNAELGGLIYLLGNGFSLQSNNIDSGATFQVAVENGNATNAILLNNNQWLGTRTITLTGINGGITNSYLFNDVYQGALTKSLPLTPAQTGLNASTVEAQCSEINTSGAVYNPACFQEQITYAFASPGSAVRVHSFNSLGTLTPVEQWNSYPIFNGQLNGVWPSIAVGNSTEGLFIGSNYQSGPPGAGEVDLLNTYKTNSNLLSAFAFYANRLTGPPQLLASISQNGQFNIGNLLITGAAAATTPVCLQIDNTGFISNTGAACGTGGTGSGTVNAGTAGQFAYYPSSGTAVNGTKAVPSGNVVGDSDTQTLVNKIYSTPSIITTSSVTASGSTNTYINQQSTAGNNFTMTLPAPTAGQTYCVYNGYNGTAGNTGAVKVLVASPSTQYIVLDGVATTSANGYIQSIGNLGDGVCVKGLSSTEWFAQRAGGSWTAY